MKILIVNPISVYPVSAMSQMRTDNMIRILSERFSVSLATPSSSYEEILASEKALEGYKCPYYPLKTKKPQGNYLKKGLSSLLEYSYYYFLGLDKEYTRYRYYNSEVIQLVKNQGFKVVISNYWEGSSFFLKLGESIFKVLDPHYAVEENWSVFRQKGKSKKRNFFEYRRLKRNSGLERKILGAADLSLPLSNRNYEIFKTMFPEKPAILVEDGTDLDYYNHYPKNPDNRTILFYGAMNSRQNNVAFWRFYNLIFPHLLQVFPELKLLIVGANPSEKVKALIDGKRIIVTGFVDDIRPYLAQAWFSIIPLELGSGFRGRVVELMAMGVPVIGTHNALDCIGLEDGKHGFISDSNEELVRISINLLRDTNLRNEISDYALEFVKKKYSLESTFGKLKEFFLTNS